MDEAEARKQGLPGSDTFLASHLAYHDPVNNASAVVSLNREALLAFSSCTFLVHREQRRVEGRQTTDWFDNGRVGTFPQSPYTLHYLRNFNLNNLMLGAGYELVLKSKLLHAGFIIHEISNAAPFTDLARRQRTEPILAAELLSVEGYMYEEINGGPPMNHLRGLTKKSLMFDRLLNTPAYHQQLGLNPQTHEIAEYVRNARNAIHLPGDPVDMPASLSSLDLVPIIIEFINTEVVDYANALVDLHGLPASAKLQRL